MAIALTMVMTIPIMTLMIDCFFFDYVGDMGATLYFAELQYILKWLALDFSGPHMPCPGYCGGGVYRCYPDAVLMIG